MELARPLAVVTPTLDGDVLRILALADADFTASRIAGMLPARTKRGIDKVLARLVAQGIVERTHAGRPSLYRLNRQHLAASAVIELARLKEMLVVRTRDLLANWPTPPVYAALFGSAVRDDHGSESDLDMFLVRPDGADDDVWGEQVADLCAHATRWTGNDARAVSFDVSEVIKASAIEPLLSDVQREGILLAGDPSWLRQALARAGTP